MKDDDQISRLRSAAQQHEQALLQRAAWRGAVAQEEGIGPLTLAGLPGMVPPHERAHIPPWWRAAAWSGATPFESSGARGLLFTLDDGSQVRLVLGPASLQELRALCDPQHELQSYLQGAQSDNWSGMPSAEVSTPAPADQV